MQYYGHLMRNNLDYAPKTVLLKALRLEGVPSFGSGNTCKKYCAELVLAWSNECCERYIYMYVTGFAKRDHIPQILISSYKRF